MKEKTKKNKITRALVPIVKLHNYVGRNGAEEVGVQALVDCIVLKPTDYERIFGNNRSQAKGLEKSLAVVKIQSNKTKKKIWRRFYGERAMYHKEYAAVTYDSFYELTDYDYRDLIEDSVTLSKGCWFKYYWFHPYHATRISARLGFISLFLAIISIILTILP